MTYLSAHLPFAGSPLPPPTSHLLVSDTLSAPGDFTIYHLVSAACSKKLKIVWVDFRGTGKASLEAVLRKLGTSLPPSFVHIAPSSLPSSVPKLNFHPCLFHATNTPSLKATYDTILPHISQDSMIILDGLTDLTYLGFSPPDIARQTGSRLITTLHADHLSAHTDDGQAELLGRLLRIASGWWRVEGLMTGRSGDVHGEISAHSLIPLPDGDAPFPTVLKSQPLQYRLETGTVKVFPKGTGRGYL